MHDLPARLRMWGRYCWRELMADRPDGACVNSLYQMGGTFDPDDEGFGEIDGNTVLAPQPEPAKAELEEIDDEDAEIMDAWIAQIPQQHRITLHRVYVLRGRKGAPQALEQALNAVAHAMWQNRRVVNYMERR